MRDRVSCKRVVLCGFVLVILSALIQPLFAQDPIAQYPLLPANYLSIRVFDNQGHFVGRILPEKRYWVPITRIPVFLQNAVVAVEDARFYEHGGIDIRGIARALVKDVVKRRLAEGGSTITQQLIKNKYLSGEKTIERKLEEARRAMEFEKKYTKKQILEMYFNEIYYGNGAWGIAQAARVYFDKNPEELTEGECLLLAGVQKAPARYNPLGKPADVSARRDVVLKRMVELGMIPQRQKQKLRSQHVAVIRPGQAPQYVAHVKNRLVERFGAGVIEQGGLDITAALDLKLQKHAEQVLRDGVKRISSDLQGALICIDPATGDLLAAVGGADPQQSSYNRAFVARRQPGSSIKPFIFAAALEQGVTAGSIWNDSPVTYDRGNNEGWRPLNYGRETYGNLSLRKALALSNNVITVKLLERVGVPSFTDFAARLGLTLHPQNGLSLALGAEEVTLSDLVLAYAPLAAGGLRPEARAIVRIYDRRSTAWTQYPASAAPAIAPETAFVTTQMLKDVMVYGTAKNLRKFSLQHASAGKTGTTDDYRDAWFVGYTPQLVTGVWVGYDKPRPGGKGFTGGAVAAPIWQRFMAKAVASRPSGDFNRPETVLTATIDPVTGYLATPECPEKRDEYYLNGTEPTEYCPDHGGSRTQPIDPADEVPAVEEEAE